MEAIQPASDPITKVRVSDSCDASHAAALFLCVYSFGFLTGTASLIPMDLSPRCPSIASSAAGFRDCGLLNVKALN
jgi:hypothetical protein